MSPLFDNHDAALTFALRFSSQQYAQSALAKLGAATGRSSDKGLVALDGAAQAGIIKARIDKLGELERAAIIARYSARVETCPCCGHDKTMDEYKEAILKLATWAGTFISSSNSAQRIRFAIVQDFFERKRAINATAKSLGIPARTAYDQKEKIWPHLSDLDKRARTQIGDQLGDLCGHD